MPLNPVNLILFIYIFPQIIPTLKQFVVSSVIKYKLAGQSNELLAYKIALIVYMPGHEFNYA